jgi:ribosomal protection tetracycline resistance protein
VKISARDPKQYIALSEALSKLNHEDPALDFNWYREEEEFQLKVNGKIQMEILQQLILDRFAIEVEFDEPEVIYKETPKRIAIGFDAYTMPKPCWAEVTFQIEPGPRGSGVVYSSKIGVNDVLQKYQNEVERTVPLALKQGIKGWEVTDLKITMIEGEDHVMHSRPGDFIIATPMAIMKGLVEADSQLLEPILKYRIESPETSLGSITSEILNLRGSFEQPQFTGDRFILNALIPVATSMEFPTFLAAETAGQAVVSTSFHSYKEVDDEFAKTRSFKGISPLDRSKYILKARRAIQ